MFFTPQACRLSLSNKVEKKSTEFIIVALCSFHLPLERIFALDGK